MPTNPDAQLVREVGLNLRLVFLTIALALFIYRHVRHTIKRRVR